jgi:hypothetical protein
MAKSSVKGRRPAFPGENLLEKDKENNKKSVYAIKNPLAPERYRGLKRTSLMS